MTDLFVEIFPLNQDAAPPLYGYKVEAASRLDTRSSQYLTTQFRRGFGGLWFWAEGLLVSDTVCTLPELENAVAILREDFPDMLGDLTAILPDDALQIPPQIQAEYAIRTRLRDMTPQINTLLRRMGARIQNARIEREHRVQPWTVMGAPALAISIASRMLYEPPIRTFVGGITEVDALREKLLGLWVQHRDDNQRGEIVAVEANPEDPADPLLTVQIRNTPQNFPASDLQLVVRIPHLRRFEIDPARATQLLQMTPADRSAQVKTASDVIKQANIIDNAYNARTQPELFLDADFEMNLRYGENRVRPFDRAKLSYDFAQCGVNRLRAVYEQRPIRVCIINTLTFRLEDFAEALQRYLQRHHRFEVEIVRERQVRVVTRSNVESAVRVVEKESPDIILTFFPDELDADDDEDADTEATVDYIRSLTLGRAIPNHVINESTLNDPDAMPFIVMTLLGKTGNAVFVLNEPLEHADYVIGLDFVRETQRQGGFRLTAINRIYRADGTFLRYLVRDLQLEEDQLPYVLMRDLFPQREFSGKRVVIHHDGPLPDDLLSALAVWGKAIKTTFYPVEVLRFGAPRLYAVGGGVIQPPWGSAFKFSDTEALLISSLPRDNITPQPLQVRTRACSGGVLPIEAALQGVLVWTLLAYGAENMPKLPVTVLNADRLSRWLAKGGTFGTDEGEVPFWL